MKFVMSVAFSDPLHYVPIARAAEEAGFHAISVSDHVVHPERIDTPYPYTEDGRPRWEPFTPWPDPLIAIGMMAATTTRLRFLTSIYVLPLRNPFSVAKSVGTVAVMSGNRVSLGVGMGWMKEEFDLLEQPFRRRGARADEMLDVLTKLWTGRMVEHHGDYYDFDRLEMSPAPTEPVPIIVGGLSEAALRRAARVGDGWTSDLHSTEELDTIVQRLRALRREYGRADEPLQIHGAAYDAHDVEGYRRLEEVGVTHLATMPWLFYHGWTDDLDEKIDGIRRFENDVIAVL